MAISRIADVMVDTGLGRTPIAEPSFGRVIGILTRHDLLKVRHLHRIAEVVRSGWSGAGRGER